MRGGTAGHHAPLQGAPAAAALSGTAASSPAAFAQASAIPSHQAPAQCSADWPWKQAAHHAAAVDALRIGEQQLHLLGKLHQPAGQRGGRLGALNNRSLTTQGTPPAPGCRLRTEAGAAGSHQLGSSTKAGRMAEGTLPERSPCTAGCSRARHPHVRTVTRGLGWL